MPADLFTCCVINSEPSDIGATHSYTKSFIKCTENGYDQLPIQVLNLSLANNAYKAAKRASATFTRLCKDIKLDAKSTHGLVAINKIQNALQKHIESIVDDVAMDVSEIDQLEKDIDNLANGIRCAERETTVSPILTNNKEKETPPSRNKAVRGKGRGRKGFNKNNSENTGKAKKSV